MLIPVAQPFDLTSTLLSGQAFRWRTHGPWFYGVVFDNVVKLRQMDQGLELFCAPDDEKTLRPLLVDYLGLTADLEAIYSAISVDDRLRAAIDRYPGMRVLRQDPWECLVSFICSSASNIPRISRNVESICSAYGRPLRLGDYQRSTFPTPRELVRAEVADLRGLGLGYRAEYVASTARAIAGGAVDLFALRESPYDEALDALISLAGVGDKVANCVLLCSLDKLDAFPIDVWVHRALQEWYLDGEDKTLSLKKMRLWAQEYFGPYSGYANQYLFHDRRLQGRPRG